MHEEPQDAFKRLKSSIEEPFQESLNLTVNISVGEILTNALTLVKKHNWSHLEKEHLMMFAKSILNSGKFFQVLDIYWTNISIQWMICGIIFLFRLFKISW